MLHHIRSAICVLYRSFLTCTGHHRVQSRDLRQTEAVFSRELGIQFNALTSTSRLEGKSSNAALCAEVGWAMLPVARWPFKLPADVVVTMKP